MTVADTSYLQIYLGPLAEYLARPDITDLYVNRPGEVWIESLGGVVDRVLLPALDAPLLLRLSRQVASLTHQGISRDHPLLAATLPDGARIQVVAAPATRGAMAVAIRKHIMPDLSLDDLEAQDAFTHTGDGRAGERVDADLDTLYQAGRWAAFLRAAVRARKTVIVSGGTSTGKTTFVNALIREIPATERLLLIEDTPELVLRHENAIGLLAVRGELGEAKVTTDDLLVASLRMRPDRIILGEIRGAEAYTFLRAVNTGHPGSLTTIHADTPARALEQIALQCLQAYKHLDRATIIEYLTTVVDVIVQLERREGRRRVVDIRWR